MLKKLGLKYQLRGLTALLLGSMFLLSGCVIRDTSSKTFYPEYYAARQLQNQDIVKLRELTVNPDLFVADSATLLLGSYYLYYGDESYGRLLIDKSYDSKNLNEEMSIFGKLWKMESLLRDGEKGVALNMATQVKEMRRTPVYMRVMQIYCNQLGILVIGDNEVNACIDEAVNGKEKFKNIAAETIDEQPLPITTDNMTYEEYLKAIGIGGAIDNIDDKTIQSEETINISQDAKIYFTGDLYDELTQGLIYGMSKYGNNYQLENISEFAANESSKDMLLKLNTADFYINGKKTNLGVDYLQLSEIAGSLDIIKNKSMAVMLVENQFSAHGNIIADTLKSMGKTVHIIDTKSNYQAEMQRLLTGKEKSSYAIIVLANEKEQHELVPIAKYWKVNSTVQDILVITGYVAKFDTSDEYSSYLRGSYVLTSSYLVDNEDYKRAAEDYKGFYSMDMSGRAALGYDIITYINKLNKNGDAKYITGIKDIINGYARRDAVLLYVDSARMVVKKTFSPKEIEGEEYLPDMQ